MIDCISLFSSVATLILFIFYFIGRIIAILSVKQIWRDKIILRKPDYKEYEIVDEVFLDNYDNKIYGILLSKDGIRKLKIYRSVPDKKGICIANGQKIFERSFLNIDHAIATHEDTGELYPTLIIEYQTFDYMKVRINWCDNLKNGIIGELVRPKHTLKSFCYYLFR